MKDCVDMCDTAEEWDLCIDQCIEQFPLSGITPVVITDPNDFSFLDPIEEGFNQAHAERELK